MRTVVVKRLPDTLVEIRIYWPSDMLGKKNPSGTDIPNIANVPSPGNSNVIAQPATFAAILPTAASPDVTTRPLLPPLTFIYVFSTLFSE